jgi:hypothetical protein
MMQMRPKLDTAEFSVFNAGQVHLFHGTVEGAIAMRTFCKASRKKDELILQSSDLNNPDEFPQFEQHAIDVDARYFGGALAAGLIEIVDVPHQESGHAS